MSNIYIIEQDIKDIINGNDNTINKLDSIIELLLENYTKEEFLVFKDDEDLAEYVSNNWSIDDIFSDGEIDDYVDRNYHMVPG